MGGSEEGPYFYPVSQEEVQAYERVVEGYKSHIKNTIQFTNKKGLKGLDALLYAFSKLSGTDFTAVGEEYLHGEMKGLDYKLKDVEDLAGDERVYNNIDKTDGLGIFISAAINNVIKPREKVYINSPRPIDKLLYGLRDAEGHVNVAGNNLGEGIVNSKIFAKTAGYEAGKEMVNSEMHIYKADEGLGRDSVGSTIYVHDASDFLGQGADHSIIFAKKAGLGAGNSMKKSKLYVDKAEEWLADYAENSEIHFGEADEKALKQIRNCKVYGKKAGDDFGEDAFRSKIYVDELGNNACDGMQDSELHFKKLNGKLGRWYIDLALPHNKVYKGESRYILPNIKHSLEFTGYETIELLKKLKPKRKDNWAEFLFYLGGF